MTARAARLVLALSLGVVALAAGRFATWWVEAEGELELAASLLVSGDPAEASARFAPYLRSPWVADRARSGAALADLVRGGASPDGLDLAAQALAADRLPASRLILWRMLRERRAGAVLALLERTPPPVRARYRVIETLARLERGELVVPAGGGDVELPRRLREIVRRRQRGDDHMLFDRRGRLVGSIASEGVVDLSDAARELDWDRWIERVVDPPADSAGTRLTLDLELSRLAREALGQDRGSVVVLDVANGDVLAVATDQRTLHREGPAFLDQLREPASISKLITTAAAMRAGVDVDHEISDHACRGSVGVEDGHVWCPVVAGRLRGLDQALAWSCNTSFARVGLELGADALLEEYRRFGFALPRAGAGGAVLASGDGSRRWLAELSIGLEQADITPLHAARMAAAFGNGGVLPEVRWTLASDGFLGVTPMRRLGDEGGTRVMAPQHAQRIAQAMRAVVTEGTARGVDSHGFPVVMKTGTASTPGKGFHVNYIGVGPWPDARYAFAVRVTDQRSSRNVRWAARRVTARLLSRLAHWDGAAPELPQDPPPRRQAALLAGGG
ncbi:MAG TPA: penicillin-binding transpeptidase domain-containing protein [Thermoanaerobaculia bacterium]|nr:penicillin-binding transpeptidase domain-containing protein [Thermoanaerobaculia bacterium]